MAKSWKQSVWPRKRIEQLIELYKSHECLWNPWNPWYRNKSRREKAMELICKELDVTKPEVTKKIHNLRNQFNGELKKYEKLLEENVEIDGSANANEYQCRWVHYQSLMFLKDIISPRPGTERQETRQNILSVKNTSTIISTDDVFIEDCGNGAGGDGGGADDDGDNVDNAEFDNYEDSCNFQNSKVKESREIITLTKSETSPRKYFMRLQTAASSESSPSSAQLKTATPSQTGTLAAGSIVELSSSATALNIPSENLTSVENKFEINDQWSAFGNFIANEFRHFHSDLSRRKLKRRIMQAMLEVGEEDDALMASICN